MEHQHHTYPSARKPGDNVQPPKWRVRTNGISERCAAVVEVILVGQPPVRQGQDNCWVTSKRGASIQAGMPGSGWTDDVTSCPDYNVTAVSVQPARPHQLSPANRQMINA